MRSFMSRRPTPKPSDRDESACRGARATPVSHGASGSWTRTDLLMDHWPAAVGLPTQHDGLYLMLHFFADVGSLTAIDGMCQNRHVAERPEFEDACFDREGRLEAALLCHP